MRRLTRRIAPQVTVSLAGAVVAVALALFVGLLLRFGIVVAAPVLLGPAAALWTIWRARTARPIPSRLTSRRLRRFVADDATGASGNVLATPQADTELVLEPLLEPRWTAGILTGMLAIEKQDGPLDIERFVDDLARMTTPTKLPRRRRRSLDAGVDVLLDASRAMVPFNADVADFLERLRRVVGEDRVFVRRYDGYPLTRTLSGPRVTDRAPEPAHMPRAVLAITNFGLSGPPGRARGPRLEHEWRELVTRLQRAGCPIVALVPHRAHLVAPSLRRRMAVIEWDRATSASTAIRARGR